MKTPTHTHVERERERERERVTTSQVHNQFPKFKQKEREEIIRNPPNSACVHEG